ncbi:hypothetical protein HY484_02850 [Candidatus Woesearchaeota archaeon]|nr:hypothetical protein [Candidatus Woesearchaeota archaeon]
MKSIKDYFVQEYKCQNQKEFLALGWNQKSGLVMLLTRVCLHHFIYNFIL